MSNTKTILGLVMAGSGLVGFGLATLVFAPGWGVVFVVAGAVCFVVSERLRSEQAHNRQPNGA